LVVDEPVRSSVLFTPSLNLDAMSTKVATRSVSVNSTLVAQKVLINAEASLNWTLGHDVVLDISNAVEVVGVSNGVHLPGTTCDAGVVGPAVRSVHKVQARLLSRSTSRNIVRIASISHNTVVGHEGPDGIVGSSLTTSSILVTLNYLSERKRLVESSLGGNAESVSSSLNTSKSPARTTSSLVINGANGLAVRPVGGSSERSRNSGVSAHGGLTGQRFFKLGSPTKERSEVASSIPSKNRFSPATHPAFLALTSSINCLLE